MKKVSNFHNLSYCAVLVGGVTQGGKGIDWSFQLLLSRFLLLHQYFLLNFSLGLLVDCKLWLWNFEFLYVFGVSWFLVVWGTKRGIDVCKVKFQYGFMHFKFYLALYVGRQVCLFRNSSCCIMGMRWIHFQKLSALGVKDEDLVMMISAAASRYLFIYS